MIMRVRFTNLVFSMAAILSALGAANAQGPVGPRNNPFSPSPSAGAVNGGTTAERAERPTISKLVNDKNTRVEFAAMPEKKSTVAVAAEDPAAVYRIGVSDLIRIDLKNSGASARYLRVGGDGRIDFPIAGENIIAAGKTVKELEFQLRNSIKIYSDPAIKVEVREFASHLVTIQGMIEQPGIQQIQRDALPFYVLRAGVELVPGANAVRIIRGVSGVTEEFSLTEEKLSSILIYAGDSVEFFSTRGLTGK